MKKYITILAVAFILISCRKESPKTCWYCTFGWTNGVQEPPRTVCNNGEFPANLKDKEGNNLSFFCEKK